MFAAGAGDAVSVKVALDPSVTAEPPAMLTTGTSSSVIEKLAVPEPLAPPPSPVPEFSFKAPRPTVTVSSPSAVVSAVALIVSVAVADALSPPVKVMVAMPLARLE